MERKRDADYNPPRDGKDTPERRQQYAKEKAEYEGNVRRTWEAQRGLRLSKSRWSRFTVFTKYETWLRSNCGPMRTYEEYLEWGHEIDNPTYMTP